MHLSRNQLIVDDTNLRFIIITNFVYNSKGHTHATQAYYQFCVYPAFLYVLFYCSSCLLSLVMTFYRASEVFNRGRIRVYDWSIDDFQPSMLLSLHNISRILDTCMYILIHTYIIYIKVYKSLHRIGEALRPFWWCIVSKLSVTAIMHDWE